MLYAFAMCFRRYRNPSKDKRYLLFSIDSHVQFAQTLKVAETFRVYKLHVVRHLVATGEELSLSISAYIGSDKVGCVC